MIATIITLVVALIGVLGGFGTLGSGACVGFFAAEAGLVFAGAGAGAGGAAGLTSTTGGGVTGVAGGCWGTGC